MKQTKKTLCKEEHANCEIVKENEQLKHILNELEKYLKENKYFYSGYQGEDREEDFSIIGVIDKIKELKIDSLEKKEEYKQMAIFLQKNK